MSSYRNPSPLVCFVIKVWNRVVSFSLFVVYSWTAPRIAGDSYQRVTYRNKVGRATSSPAHQPPCFSVKGKDVQLTEEQHRYVNIMFLQRPRSDGRSRRLKSRMRAGFSFIAMINHKGTAQSPSYMRIRNWPMTTITKQPTLQLKPMIQQCIALSYGHAPPLK